MDHRVEASARSRTSNEATARAGRILGRVKREGGRYRLSQFRWVSILNLHLTVRVRPLSYCAARLQKRLLRTYSIPIGSSCRVRWDPRQLGRRLSLPGTGWHAVVASSMPDRNGQDGLQMPLWLRNIVVQFSRTNTWR